MLFFISICGITYYLYDTGNKRQKEIDDMVMEEGESKPRNYRMYASYVLMVICVLFALTIVCLFTKIKIAISIMEASADFVTEVPFVLLVPPIITLVTLGWILIWIYLA